MSTNRPTEERNVVWTNNPTILHYFTPLLTLYNVPFSPKTRYIFSTRFIYGDLFSFRQVLGRGSVTHRSTIVILGEAKEVRTETEVNIM